ncbi:hemagglutinin/hemolysin-like protein [Neisseria gonorrhoeae]|uniref:Hemagglutinin/hemolysin-like protein n=1 Tax=Neisseria gonorrhoeae TaxID=485 RepID=A0A378VZA7_NEIGO|nr:hemagglutinin/hemolysin-like protein [Neisseria gonorrhoeae]
MGAGGSEAAAPIIGKWLYGKGDGGSLNAEEKETVSAITRMLGTAAGAAEGNSSADAVWGCFRRLQISLPLFHIL